MSDERGFTLPELLIAVAIFIALGVATLGVARGLSSAVDRRSATTGGVVAMEQEIVKLRGDADTAFAVFVPKADVFGQPNVPTSASPAPHEVDFYTKTDRGAETYWAYRFDANAHTLQRYDYDPTSNRRGVFDRTTGAIDPTGSYPPLVGVRAFAATTIQANDLADARKNPFASLIAGLTGGKAPTGDPVGFVPASGVPREDLFGGNASVRVDIATDRGDRTLHLVPGAMASGFTIHKALAIRSILYRRNTHNRSWFGLVGKTRAHVYEQLQYLLPREPNAKWKVWCDYEVYGVGAGMGLGDRNVHYRPYQDFNETAGFAFFNVTHDGYEGNRPSADCSPKYPTPNTTPGPTPTPATADVLETPPPCFAQGTCWPENAPPNWAPPSPWPVGTPPPGWCAGHQQSPLCGGNGLGPPPTPNPGNVPTFQPYVPPPDSGASFVPSTMRTLPSGGAATIPPMSPGFPGARMPR